MVSERGSGQGKRRPMESLMALAGQLRGRLVDNGQGHGECRLSEIRSPFRLPAMGVSVNLLLPWTRPFPWADALLTVAATRFNHVNWTCNVLVIL